jgi:hypothetical protein
MSNPAPRLTMVGRERTIPHAWTIRTIALGVVEWAHTHGLPFQAVVAETFSGEDHTVRH